ncbi:hypothetical protein [Micromonospora sp. LOL_023]|uniref:hypothetical protein n=1 Tax=Micromonospora sp. LOL_023 TaxID=3345418 RepID=UPI003A89A011
MRTKMSMLGRIAAMLLTTAATTMFGAVPAAAADGTDLGVAISGNVVNSYGSKATVITVTNHGPGAASGIILDLSETRVDSEAIDPGTVHFCDSLPGTEPQVNPPSPDPDPEHPNRGYDIPVAGKCALADLPAGRSIRLETEVTVWHPMGIPIGTIRARISHDGTDPVAGNDAAQASLITVGHATDLYVRAWDVPYRPEGETGAVVPGEATVLHYEVGNPGTAAVTGITLTVRLPDQVEFTESLAGCQYDIDRTETTCAYPDLQLVPKSAQTATAPSAVIFTHEIRVLPSAPAPAVLADGSVALSLTGATDDVAALAEPAASASVLPAGAVAAVASDIDPSDNRDSFAVTTGPAGGDGAGLPVTGPDSRTIAGLGLVALLFGALLTMLARRGRPLSRARAGELTG